MSFEKALAAKVKHAGWLLGCPLVNGVGVTKFGEGYALKLNLSAALGSSELPTEIDGVPVMMQVVGPLRKFRAS